MTKFCKGRDVIGDTKKIIILGATGGPPDILDTINDINATLPEPKYECIGFLDDKDSLRGTKVLGVEVLSTFKSAREFGDDVYFITGIGSPYNFWKKEEIIVSLGLKQERFVTVSHPTANLISTVELGFGCVVHQQVTVTRNVKIGNHVMVLPNTTISHGDIVGDYSIINAGA